MSETGERLADEPPVLGERVPVGVLAELVQEPGRALDVGEHQGDRAGGLLHHRRTPLSAERPRKPSTARA
jgi:hypothetical protein